VLVGIARRVLDIPVSEIGLRRADVVSPGGQCEPASLPQHVRMRLEAELRLHTRALARKRAAAAVGTCEFSVTQSGVEVVQDPELGKDDRPLWVAVEAFDLAVFEFEHVAARGVHLLTRGR